MPRGGHKFGRDESDAMDDGVDFEDDAPVDDEDVEDADGVEDEPADDAPFDDSPEPGARRVARVPHRPERRAGRGDVGERLAARGRGRVRKGRRRFDSGNAVSKSLAVWMANLIPFTLLSALVFTPLIIYALLQIMTPLERLTVESATRYDRVTNLLGNFLHIIVQGAVVFGVFRKLRGSTAGIGECITVGLRKLFPVIGVALLLVVLMIAPFLPGFLIMLTGNQTGMGLGVILLLAAIVPFLIIRLGTVAAVPVMVVEGGSVFGAIRRSWELSKGYKGAIWRVLFVIGMLTALIGCLVGGGLGAAQNYTLSVVVLLGLKIVLAGLDATVGAVIYHDLRVTKEGIASEELAAVFD